METHKSAILVVLSYIIGFTTAFIMFVLVDDLDKKGKHYDKMSPEEVLMMDEMGADMSSVEVMENTEGLFIKKDGQERILSALSTSDEAEPGFHTDIAAASVSPNHEYVHYCAVMSANAETCQHFVYSLEEDTTYMVKDGEEALVSPAAEATLVSWTDMSELDFSGRVAGSATLWVVR